MAWKNGELFKLKKQQNRCYQACFVWDKYHWISTREHDKDAAVKWCENYVLRSGKGSELKSNSVLFSQVAEGFFTPADPMGYIKRRQTLGKINEQDSYKQRQGFLNNYIIPVFKNIPLEDISILMIEDWYLFIENKKNKGKLLSTGTRTHILKTLSIILDECVRLNLIKYNPCEKVEKIKVTYKDKKIFSDDMLKNMFPDNPINMLEIWDNIYYALYFSIAIDTGWRAGEILALHHDDFKPEFKGIYSTHNINTASGAFKDTVKTATTGGYKYRIGFLSDRSIRLIGLLPDKNKNGYFFSKDGSGETFISHDALLRKLKSVLREKIRIEDWNDYAIHNFRHTFMTRIKSNMDETLMLKLMGHTGYRREYDHSNFAQRFKEVEKARTLIPKIG